MHDNFIQDCRICWYVSKGNIGLTSFVGCITHKSHEQVHDKRGIAESLHVYINRARLTVCEVGLFSREGFISSELSPSVTSLTANIYIIGHFQTSTQCFDSL